MMSDLAALLLVSLGLWSAGAPGLATADPGLSLPLLAFLALATDTLLLLPVGSNSSRVSPVLAASLMLTGRGGFVVALLALLAGGASLALRSQERRGFVGDLLRSLAPLGAMPVVLLPLPGPFPQVAAAGGFVLISLTLEPRRPILRANLLTLLSLPWMALALHLQDPVLLILLLPVLLVLGRGKDESVSLAARLRTALAASRLATKNESLKTRRMSALLLAADKMSRSLDPEVLRAALQHAATATGVENVTVVMPAGSRAFAATSRSSIPLLQGLGRLEFSGPTSSAQREHLEMLTRIFATCWENVELHSRVLQALEQTRLSQVQLVESSRLAALGLMAAGVAHEMNSPLGAIQLSAEVAQRYLEVRPEAVNDQLQTILRSTERARRAVVRLLTYTRKNTAEEEAEAFAVSEVLEDVLDMLAHQAQRLGVRVKPEVSDNDLEMVGVRQALFSLVFNLLLNAIMAAGGAEIACVWIRCYSVDHETFVLEVEDSGPGVSDTVAPRLFEAFFTTKPSGEGTGLGLHLGKEAAQHLGGTLELMPARGHGAVFQARLPRLS